MPPPQLEETLLAWSTPRAPSADLVAVARDTLRAWEAMGGTTAPGLPSGTIGPVETTLRWVVAIGEADAASGADRLGDPRYLSRCLSSWRWVPDVSRPKNHIRLTRYLVYSVLGRVAPEGLFQFPLWSLPKDETGIDAVTADQNRGLTRFRYTRQDVVAGVFKAGGAAAGQAEPLVWLDREAHEQALLQGTVAMSLGEGTQLYNVHRNNGIAYDKAERDTRKQRGYWYFRTIDAVRGWAQEPVPGPALRPYVAVAGDLQNVGFGRLLALQSDDGLRLVVVADTGGAFVDNRHQLDLYTGVHSSFSSFQAATSGVGDTAAAWALKPRLDVDGCQ